MTMTLSPVSSFHDRLSAWLTLDYSVGVSQAAVRRCLEHYGSPQAILDASQQALSQLIGEAAAQALKSPNADAASKRSAWVQAALTWLAAGEQGARHILCWDDPLYPAQLLTIPDPPMSLFVQGSAAVLQRPAVGIVGARNATQQGVANAKVFAQHLAAQGVVVVSGMALGVDAAAHEGALLSGMNDSETGDACTIAVVGTGIDRVYPAAHRDLAHRIAARGAVVSEFPIGTPPLAANFPRRNRLISGLSRGVLVVEAAVRSGSLITARVAGEQGREVLAIPGSIHAPLSRGCHQLIKQGAKLVESGQDVLEELGLTAAMPFGRTKPAKSTQLGDSGAEPASESIDANPILLAIGFAPTSLDQIMSATGLDAAAILPQLTELELFGDIEALPGGRYQRISA